MSGAERQKASRARKKQTRLAEIENNPDYKIVHLQLALDSTQVTIGELKKNLSILNQRLAGADEEIKELSRRLRVYEGDELEG